VTSCFANSSTLFVSSRAQSSATLPLPTMTAVSQLEKSNLSLVACGWPLYLVRVRVKVSVRVRTRIRVRVRVRAQGQGQG